MECANSAREFVYTFNDLTLLLESQSGDIDIEDGKVSSGTNDDNDKNCSSSTISSSLFVKTASAPPSSSFDLLLTSLWENAMRNDLFRYKLSKNCLPFKLLPGQFNYIAQLNPDRAQKRRKPQEIQSVNQPFNPNEFHFNKVDPNEILMAIKPPWSSLAETDDHHGSHEHSLLINVSPLEYCHVLLTPFRQQCRPQGLTKESLHLALDLCLLSNSSDLRVGFNSLCGFASVNHEHYHAYYLSHRLFIEYAPLIRVPAANEDWQLFQLEDTKYPPGLCIVLTDLDVDGVNAALNSVMKLATYFQGNDVGHNLFITRGSTKNVKGHFDSVRIFVWARKSSFGAKACDAFNPALCELAGHFPIKSEEAYANLTEEYILEELHEICDEPYKKVLKWLILESL